MPIWLHLQQVHLRASAQLGHTCACQIPLRALHCYTKKLVCELGCESWSAACAGNGIGGNAVGGEGKGGDVAEVRSCSSPQAFQHHVSNMICSDSARAAHPEPGRCKGLGSLSVCACMHACLHVRHMCNSTHLFGFGAANKWPAFAHCALNMKTPSAFLTWPLRARRARCRRGASKLPPAAGDDPAMRLGPSVQGALAPHCCTMCSTQPGQELHCRRFLGSA